MTDLYNKIVSERGSVENLLSKIPGFRGYMEMSSRREADRSMRDHVAKQYETQLNRLATIESELVRAGGLLFMENSKRIKTRLETLRRRIATDSPGYSGFFASNKIGPDELQRVYAFDEAMLRYVDQIAQKLDTFQTSVSTGAEIEGALSQLDAVISEALQAYDLRDSVFKELA